MGQHGRARLFIAVDPPLAVRAELAAWARGAARTGALGPGAGTLRVLDAELLHVTVCFLGERPAWEIEQIARALRGVEGSAGELALGAPVWLPPRRPRALAVEVAMRESGLDLLRERVFEVLSVAPEDRRFRPHVTVARVPARAVLERRELPPTPALSFAPEELVLYRSRLSPAGASYEALASLELWAH
jgi:RNA 2',3'-cyclic 3'-phosphodiesterase